MRRIVYSVAMSLDGYVAGLEGETDWIVMDPEIDFGAFMERFDTILLGRRTFEAAQSQRGGGTMPGMRTVLVSTTLSQADYPDVTLISSDVASAVSRLRSEPGKDIWLFGGGSLFRSLLDLGLVDRVEVAVIPVLLGGGVPLLPTRSQRAQLRLDGSRTYAATGTIMLEYAVERIRAR